MIKNKTTMDYEILYKNALERAKKFIEENPLVQNLNTWIKETFPELKEESEDEKVRKALIEMVHDTTGDELWVDYNVHKEEALAWLEKQDTERKQLYVRFGDIPSNEKSKIYHGEDEIGDEEYNGEDYGIDSLWHAKNILEETLGKVDGYQTDDGILEHKCAIAAVNKLYKQKPWSEEDEKIFDRICALIHSAAYKNYDVDEDGNECGEYANIKEWFKKLKDRVQPQTTWKPSDEQMELLKDASARYEGLQSLYNDLNKLKGE